MKKKNGEEVLRQLEITLSSIITPFAHAKKSKEPIAGARRGMKIQD